MSLKPCPFCGSPSLLVEVTPPAMGGSIVTYAFVECQTCRARAGRYADWDDKTYREKAAAAWNTRPQHAAVDESKSGSFWLLLMAWAMGFFTPWPLPPLIVFVVMALEPALCWIVALWWDAHVEEFYHHKINTPPEQGGWKK